MGKVAVILKRKNVVERLGFRHALPYENSLVVRFGGAADNTIIPAMIGKHINKIIAGSRDPQMSSEMASGSGPNAEPATATLTAAPATAPWCSRP